MSEKRGAEHFEQEIGESAMEKAERLTLSQLKSLGWDEADLSRHRNGDPKKARIGLRLRG